MERSKEKTKTKDQNQDIKKPGQSLPAAIDPKESPKDPDILTELEANIYDLVDRYINTLDDPEELKQNNGLFVDMLKYIYRYYLKFTLKNDTNIDGNRYDYDYLNSLFKIYTSLVYRYKKNNRPLISEFCIFCNISDSTLYSIRKGEVKKASSTDIHNVKMWFKECENALSNGGSVFEIFLLKSCYGYNDNLAPIPIEAQGQALSINQLPDLTKNDQKQLLPGDKEQTEKARKP